MYMWHYCACKHDSSSCNTCHSIAVQSDAHEICSFKAVAMNVIIPVEYHVSVA
jgi:hypothetical protein